MVYERLYTLAYLLLFGLLGCLNRYDIWLSLPPASIHQWRQADGAAIAWHYTQHPDFWKASICNLSYTGDAHTVGELPLLYWLAGLIAHTGFSPAFPLRWIGLFLLLLGCWAFGWVVLKLSKSPLIALLTSGLLLTTPVLAYYGPNFLPDAPAFCFVLLMVACLYQAHEKQSRGWLISAALAAALAILLKLSMAILPLALISTWFETKRRHYWAQGSMWQGKWPVIGTIVALGVVLGFRWWILAYNAAHHANYFLASTRPIWHYDQAFILETLAMMTRFGLPAFASLGLYLLFFALLYLSIKNWKSIPFAIKYLWIVTALGCTAYSLLWFRMLREHDYYYICLLVMPMVMLLNGLSLWLHRYKRLALGLAACLLLSIGHNGYIMNKRLRLAFHPENSQQLPPDAFFSDNEVLTIPLSAKVFCPQDPSPNIALFALKRQGWTAYNFGDRITADSLQKYQALFGLTQLALRDTAYYSVLYQGFFPNKAGRARGWYFYAK